MDFLTKFKKDLEKSNIEVGASAPPKYWFSTGNYALNKIISGSFLRGIPQGRITCLTGPSGAGKSFLVSNIMREAQQEGAHLVVLDSENALDDDFVTNVGVDVTTDYTYVPVDTISQTKKVVSSFIQGYKNEYGKDPDAPKVHFALDSLDMLMTDTEQDNFDAGVLRGDFGQRSKQLKAMLREFVQAIKRTNISMTVTAQVYKNQTPLSGEGFWIVSDAIKFSLSQIILLTKLKLKDEETKETSGIRMKCEGYKSRFTRPFQSVVIEVPYNTGIDPYNGLLDVAVEMGVVERKVSWCSFNENNFRLKDFKTYASDILIQCEANRKKFLDVLIEDDDLELTPQLSSKKKREEKFDELNKS